MSVELSQSGWWRSRATESGPGRSFHRWATTQPDKTNQGSKSTWSKIKKELIEYLIKYSSVLQFKTIIHNQHLCVLFGFIHTWVTQKVVIGALQSRYIFFHKGISFSTCFWKALCNLLLTVSFFLFLNCDTKCIYQILPNYLYLLTYTSWQSKMFNLQQNLNFTSSDISHKDLRSKLNKTFVDMIFEQNLIF